MKGISTEAKVGLLVLLSLFILAFLTFRAGHYEFTQKNGHTLKIIFRSIAGLDEKARVKVRGVDAGYVEAISLMPEGAQLTLRIKTGTEIRKNAVARIQSLGLMGEKYIEIEPGSDKFPLLKEGDWISVGLESKDFDQLAEQIGTLSEDLMAITHSIKSVIATQEGRDHLSHILENMDQLTSGMKNTIVQNQEEINRLIKNLADFSQELDTLLADNKGNVTDIIVQGKKTIADIGILTENLKHFIDPNTEGLGSTFGKLPKITQKLDMTLGQFYEITERLNKGEGTIGKLLKDDKVYEEISGSLGQLHTTLKKAEDFTLYLSFRGEYMTEYQKSKSYFSLKFQPREKKYYMLEFVSDFKDHIYAKRKVVNEQGVVTSLEEESEDKILINLLMAHQFGPFFLKGGLIESKGGLGMDYYPFGKQISVGLEGWDFNQTRPHLKLSSKLIVKKYFFFNVGWDDFLNARSQSSFAGVGFTFEDADLKYLLTKLPLPGL